MGRRQQQDGVTFGDTDGDVEGLCELVWDVVMFPIRPSAGNVSSDRYLSRSVVLSCICWRGVLGGQN